MNENNKICICCGQSYSYCPKCGADVHKPSWYSIYHDENCRNLFNIATDVLNNDIDKTEAKRRFEQCVIPDRKMLHHSVIEALTIIDDFSEKTKQEQLAMEEKQKLILESPVKDIDVNKNNKTIFTKKKKEKSNNE